MLCPDRQFHSSKLFVIDTDFTATMNAPITGYAEGFYGRLLSWTERRKIIDCLQRLGLSSYYYAPKEDSCHRLHWREPYAAKWHTEFKHFCTYAHDRGIQVVAGVAPGLDFEFAHLPDGTDFQLLVSKSQALLDNGADKVSLLMDDIDADFNKRCGRYASEGQAHASLANALGIALSKPDEMKNVVPGAAQTAAASVWVTPRIYANELMVEDEQYLKDFVKTLDQQHCVLYCGSDVVAYRLDEKSANSLAQDKPLATTSKHIRHRVIIWDNLYANDYCPRRLFTGPWLNRKSLQDVLLNPTGMVHTDCLLLELMAVQMQNLSVAESERVDDMMLWRKVLASHGVPSCFHAIAPFFYHPYFNSGDNADNPDVLPADDTEIRAAIEHCLWRWKTPLAREWYPFLFGLKHDLLTLSGHHPRERILKTQNAPLARLLLPPS